ncbi:MAG TPA: antibiotic biosynthesis monooxygenase family protein [Candidatus Dormibacteraeota bacterium]|nr:antibiotic biosynthesis monooxygenase family protein [Candidatus Dormibacteraeota bacterium]
MAEHAKVIDVSRYYPAQGKRDELLSAMKELAAKAASSPGCYGAQVCESDQEQDALVAISRWASESDLDGFAGSPSFVTDRERMASLLGKPAQREHFHPH